MEMTDVVTCIVVILGSEFYPNSRLTQEQKGEVLRELGQNLGMLLRLPPGQSVQISWESLGGTRYQSEGTICGFNGVHTVCGTSNTHLLIADRLGLFCVRFTALLGDGSYPDVKQTIVSTISLASGSNTSKASLEGQAELATAFRTYLLQLPHNTVLIGDQWPVAGYLNDPDCTESRVILVEHTPQKIVGIYPFLHGQLRQLAVQA
jgi:hypothetical protein